MANRPTKLFKILHYLPAEVAHNVTLKVIKSGMIQKNRKKFNLSNLKAKIGKLEFDHPLGIAAGFDKNIETINLINRLGISHMEFGTVTPKPQLGNKKPRIFRLYKDSAIINRLGFPNQGAESAKLSLSKNNSEIPIGVNIGCNKDSSDYIKDYSLLAEKLGPFCEWLTLNVSSPNTPELRTLQEEEILKKLLKDVTDSRKKIEDENGKSFQIWLKISPDLNDSELQALIDISIKSHIDAICISNTTISKSENLVSKKKKEIGGLSGPPLHSLSTKMLAKAYLYSDNRINFVGIGGISDGETAYLKIIAGANLIQLYTGLVFNGSQLIEEIINYLSIKCIKTNLNDLVGSKARSIVNEDL